MLNAKLPKELSGPGSWGQLCKENRNHLGRMNEEGRNQVVRIQKLNFRPAQVLKEGAAILRESIVAVDRDQ